MKLEIGDWQAGTAGRQIVGKWLRVKAEGRTGDWQCLMQILEFGPDNLEQKLERLLRQLSADAEHSDLLYRLFTGGEFRE